MIVAVTGPLCSGKRVVAERLVAHHGFRHVTFEEEVKGGGAEGRQSAKRFDAAHRLLEQVTAAAAGQLDVNFVVTGISQVTEIDILRRRPCTVVVAVGAPFLTRFRRHQAKQLRSSPPTATTCDEEVVSTGTAAPPAAAEVHSWTALMKFAAVDTLMNFGTLPVVTGVLTDPSTGEEIATPRAAVGEEENQPTPAQQKNTQQCEGGDIVKCVMASDIALHNKGTVEEFVKQIDNIPGLGKKLIRPDWDTYFMRLAFLASSRSSCLKRRVGALIVKDTRLVATGYNGTAVGTPNCNDGGCERCKNPSVKQGRELEACECIHAEANALIESGRDRSVGGVLYCTTMPCLACAKLVVQAGIKRVVYGLPYDETGGAAALFKKGQVVIEHYSSQCPDAVRLGAVDMFMPPQDV